MDEQLRRAERAAATGNPEAVAHWRYLCGRRGLFFKDHRPDEILSEWEEAQEDYDELWWHTSRGRKCGLWSPGDLRTGDFYFRTSVFKTCSKWGHLQGGKNSKRQTIRTHRDGSRRGYRFRNKQD